MKNTEKWRGFPGVKYPDEVTSPRTQKARIERAPEGWIPLREAAARLGCSKPTARRILRGVLCYTQAGSFASPSYVQNIIEDREAGTHQKWITTRAALQEYGMSMEDLRVLRIYGLIAYKREKMRDNVTRYLYLRDNLESLSAKRSRKNLD